MRGHGFVLAGLSASDLVRLAVYIPRNARVLHPTLAIHALLKQYAHAIWVDESGLSTSDVRQWMALKAG
ncbi:MAG: hypothetical protein RLZZ221_2281, partial [Verrucomicrobiota bacterium]